jgi:SPP1 gp7 family putative phage head morphogenesis protein
MAVVLDPLPPQEAIDAFAKRGALVESFSWKDLWQEQHTRMFTVAKSAGFDVLDDIRQAVEQALADGTTLKDFSKQLQPVLAAKGWWGEKTATDPQTGEETEVQLGSPRRLATIFNTNLRVSYAAGHWSQFEATKKDRPYLRYVAVLDARTRPAHRARHNVCLPVDDPWWDLWAPPCGWNCRCTLQSLSQRDVDKLGDRLKFKPPPDVFRTWINNRTGEALRVADGIDPGWGYNPGKAGWQATPIAEKLVGASPKLAAAAAAQGWFPADKLADEFAAWFAQAAQGKPLDRPRFTIGALDPDVLTYLARIEAAPQSAAVTIDQAAARGIAGDKAARAALQRLPEMIGDPKAVLVDRRSGELLYVFDAPGGDRLNRLVVTIARRDDKLPGGALAPIATNAISAAALTPRIALTDPARFEIAAGALD